REPSQSHQRLDVVGLEGPLRDAVRAQGSAAQTAVDDLQMFLAPSESDRLHESAARRRAVTGDLVDVNGPEAARTVIPVASVREWLHALAARRAPEPRVLGASRPAGSPRSRVCAQEPKSRVPSALLPRASARASSRLGSASCRVPRPPLGPAIT